ncbi:uncharacterized protein F5Z01DRAFT_438488 [Emericellopsis atlantica]|uniref:Uncharacterized protein n=1 Tax=Emericellopsis atlantica TaxID=2614577 RepID=A0A9P8CJZ0_9HYPO|nr:uncharacterized protein F5Z01DRAFT_438488 [Emericellopsis atlantica]KAG9249823.1 hypothetical protein F5Z01DRAFT_438488 [Emericellopsis atlantica]
MFFDTEHNSARTVLATLRAAFEETARKMSAYIKCMPKGKQPTSKIITRTIIKLTDLALRLLTGRSRKLRNPEYQCDIRRRQVAL